jgi:D-amino-acid dehydrogenase
MKTVMDMGGVIRCGQEVVTIDSKGTRTQDAVYAADHYIVCSGYSAARLLGRKDIKGLKGYSRTYHVPGLGGDLPPVPIMDDAHHFALTPLGDHLRVSGGAHGVDDEPGDIYDRFEEFAFTLLPHLKTQLSAARYSDWSAIRPMSESGPIIDYDYAHKVWLNVGHGHMGWTLSAGAAQTLTDLIDA